MECELTLSVGGVQSATSQETCSSAVPCVTSPTVGARPVGGTVSAATIADERGIVSTGGVTTRVSLGSLVCGRHSHGRKPRSRPLSGRFQNDDRMTSSAGSEHTFRPETPVR